MKNPIRLLSILMIAALIFSAQLSKAQSSSDFKTYWYVNASGGLSLFFGDIKQNSFLPSTMDVSEWKFGGGLMFGKQFSPLFGLRGQSLYGQLLGSKREIGRFVEGDYYEFSLSGTLSLSNLFWKYNKNRKLDFYAIGGIGLTNFNMTQRSLSNNSIIKMSGHDFGSGLGGRTLEGVLVAGLGIDYEINNKWSINFETSFRPMTTDELDVFENGSKNDMYNYTSLGISFKFGHKVKKKYRKPEPIIIKKEKIPIVELEEKQEKVAEKPIIVEKPKEEIVEKPIVKKELIPVVPEPEYRVQIRACFGKKLMKEALSETYKIPVDQIKEDMHKGYYIYTVGSYVTYDQARNKRDVLRSQNGVFDAFVVCFSQGKRLSKLPD